MHTTIDSNFWMYSATDPVYFKLSNASLAFLYSSITPNYLSNLWQRSAKSVGVWPVAHKRWNHRAAFPLRQVTATLSASPASWPAYWTPNAPKCHFIYWIHNFVCSRAPWKRGGSGIFEEYLGLDDAGAPWAVDCYPSMLSSMETPLKPSIRSSTASSS